MDLRKLFAVSRRSVVVTGGASGIGFAIVDILLDQGAKVVIIDRDTTKLENAVSRLLGRDGPVRSQICDVTDSAGLRGAFEAVATAQDGIDIVFANAGIGSTGNGQRGLDGTNRARRARRPVRPISSASTRPMTNSPVSVNFRKFFLYPTTPGANRAASAVSASRAGNAVSSTGIRTSSIVSACCSPARWKLKGEATAEWRSPAPAIPASRSAIPVSGISTAATVPRMCCCSSPMTR